MTRLLGWFICGALVCFVAIALFGRAFDVETQDRVIFTKDGVTLDCARHYGGHGNVSYGDCNRVP